MTDEPNDAESTLHPIQTKRLYNPRTFKEDEFPLYTDEMVGLAAEWVGDL